MWSSRTGRRIAVALLLLSLPTLNAAAGTISSINAVILPGNSTGSISLVATPAPNNDNAVGSGPNVILYSIVLNSGGVGSLDVEFNIANSGNTTEYWFTQSLVNNTASLWTGFHYELGFGTGASFVRSTSADPLDLDAPDGDPVPTSGNFSVFALEADTLEWSGGSVPFVSSLSQAFSIDVPDNLSMLNPGGQNRFTLRQRPMTSSASIPEPATLTLLGLGLVGLGFSCRKQQRTRRHRLLRCSDGVRWAGREWLMSAVCPICHRSVSQLVRIVGELSVHRRCAQGVPDAPARDSCGVSTRVPPRARRSR